MKKPTIALLIFILGLGACQAPEQEKQASTTETEAVANQVTQEESKAADRITAQDLIGRYKLDLTAAKKEIESEAGENTFAQGLAKTFVEGMDMEFELEKDGKGKFKMGMLKIFEGLAEAFSSEMSEEEKKQINEGIPFEWKLEGRKLYSSLDSESGLVEFGEIIGIKEDGNILLQTHQAEDQTPNIMTLIKITE